MKSIADLRAPFPYMGGKSIVAPAVWRLFGPVRNYVEPFAGSLAVLLGRPRPFDGTETVNDLDGMLANFWRSLANDPDAVAFHADWPVNELDLHARHLWLVEEGRKRVERLRTDPDYHDAKIAGWWVWGISQWIGGRWCLDRLKPHKSLPHLGDAGRGVHRVSLQLPHLTHLGSGVHSPGVGNLYDYFAGLAARLRFVRVCCGDWSRVCGPTPTTEQGLTAVFLDPPYCRMRRAEIYAVDTDPASEVRAWCHANGANPLFRIALCGYGTEHVALEECGWRVFEWKAKGGYGSQSDGRGRENSKQERIWYSPNCLHSRTLFDEEDAP